MYVIRNVDSGKYVARFPDPHTYTKDVTKARTFWTAQGAVKYGMCDNERAVPIADLFFTPE